MRTPPTLIHQFQPDDKTCVCTSIAMLVGLPKEEVIAKWHKFYMDGGSIREILDDYRLFYRTFDSLDRSSLIDIGSGYYLITVPSLNIPAGHHQIVMEYDDDSGIWAIYDPQAGKADHKWYQAVAAKEGNAYPLSGYIIDAFIPYPNLET